MVMNPSIELSRVGICSLLALGLVTTAAALPKTAIAQHQISGQVTDSSTGLPIGDATVSALPAGQSQVTDVEGNYSMTVDAGDWSFEASADGYQTGTVDLLVEMDEVVDFALSPVVFTISGTISNDDDLVAIVGATVRALPDGPSTSSGAGGVYSFDIAPGSWTLEVSAAGFEPQTREVEVTEARVEDFALVPEIVFFDITGVVTGESDGNPISGATVRALPGGPSSGTGADGSYSMELEPGSWTLEASATGYVTHSRDVNVTGVAVEDFELQREPGVTIGGRVRDDLGRWLAGASVDLVGGQRNRNRTTAADGSFTFTGVAPNTLYSITASMDAHRSDSRNLQIGQSDLFDVILTLVFVPVSHIVSGHVLDGVTNDPVLGAQVQIPALDASTTTDRDGEFYFRLVPPGDHTITADADGYAEQSVEITVTDDNLDGVEILLGRDGSSLSLTGRVTMEGLDLPIGGATVYLTHSGGERREKITDQRGAFSFLGLVAGRYELEVSAGGYDPHRETVDIDLPTELDVVLERRPGQGFELYGTVQLEGRVSGDWSGTTVRIADSESPDSTIAEVGTADDGDYQFDNLAPGSYRLEASRRDYVPAGLTVLIASDTSQHFILYPSDESDGDWLFGCDCSSAGSGRLWPALLLLALGLFRPRSRA